MVEVTELDILRNVITVLVHQMPDRILTIRNEDAPDDPGEYEHHQIGFRMRDGVMEAVCGTCLQNQTSQEKA
jgi:hypothetical protein